MLRSGANASDCRLGDRETGFGRVSATPVSCDRPCDGVPVRASRHFLSAHWDGTVETEVAIKEATKATIRCIPVDAVDEEGVCVFSGRPSHRRVLFARSY